MKTLPHPSITGLASGALILKYLNDGGSGGTTVFKPLMEGNFQLATSRFLSYAPALVTSSSGKRALVSSIAIAVAGGIVRKAAPNVKLGGSKIFARI